MLTQCKESPRKNDVVSKGPKNDAAVLLQKNSLLNGILSLPGKKKIVQNI